ncbi:MAG: 2-succinyl-5-enolpyruvyl-6-hydroxy-3-cyclohexene-1-carboxylic-acid synthase [Solirubrobacteraceae bacterium]
MTDSPADAHLLLRALVDEFARCGMSDACTSPGSRCTPIVLALAREPRLRAHSHIDERCAGFFALGLAKRTERPVAVTCTSGTAAANLLPAVIEAHEARVPLLVLTADRPPELRGVGAGQTIDQLKLYGGAVRWFVELGSHDAEAERWIRDLACRAYWTACGPKPGPVHLNVPLREPLVLDGPVPDGLGGRSGGRPWLTRRPAPRPRVDLGEHAPAGTRAVLVAGRSEVELGLPALAEAAGQPLLADPLSGARSGPAAIAGYDALLRKPPRELTPDLVIRFGELPTSKPLRTWLSRLDEVPQIAVNSNGQDPAGVVELALEADSVSALGAAPDGWLSSWREAEPQPTFGSRLTEPLVARTLGECLPPEATLWVASSMPIRDVESFWPARVEPPRVLSNRGANGIDGTVSSAFGAAAAAGSGPVVLLLGDVALAHDIGGLLAARRLGLALTIVLIDNGGGGIFDFLPVSGEREIFERHVATPTGLSFAAAANLYGLRHELIESAQALREAVLRSLAGGCALLEVQGERSRNVTDHRDVWER